VERSEVVALREALEAARKARRKARRANHYRASLGLPALPLPEVDPDEYDAIPEPELMARIAEVSRVKQGLRRLKIRPRLTPEELERVLP
jgi:hypothetical protein